MDRDLDEIAARALRLAPEENERLWARESARRYQQLANGTARSIPSDEVFGKLDARPRK